MKIKSFRTATSAAALTIAFGATPALATGTPAGTNITNSVTVGYEVGGIAQQDESDEVTITVDRKINLTVARTDNSATEVTPGATQQAVSFQIENVSNDTLDFALAATQLTTGASAGISGTDSFDVTVPMSFYIDDGDGVFDGGDGSPVTHLDAVAPDAPVVIHVVAAGVPLGLSADDIAGVTLTATARQNDGTSALGAAFTQAGTNTAGVDTIFADGAGASDTARDAAFSATDDYIVLTAAITATKTNTIVAGDYGTGAAIPGATVQYCIAVANASGGTAASSISISDVLPTEVTYDGTYGVRVGGADCNTPGSGNGTETGGTVSGTISSLPAGTTQTMIYQAVIN